MATPHAVSDCCRMKRRVTMVAVVAMVSVWMCSQGLMAQVETATPTGREAVDRLPQAVGPGGIGTVTWPDPRDGVASLMGALPPVVAGEPRTRPPVDGATDRLRVSYGEAGPLGPPLVVQVLDVASGDFYPSGWTGAEVVALLASEPADGTMEAAGNDGDVTWMVGSTTASMEGDPGTSLVRQEMFTVAWAVGDSQWVFSVAAFTLQGRNALLAAMVGAAKLEPATPSASPPGANPAA